MVILSGYRWVIKMLTAVILAAGEAKRMGELKQLLKWNQDNTILGATIDNLLAAQIVDEEILIILGSQSERVKAYLDHKYNAEILEAKIRILKNKDYKTGMLSSVKTALRNLKVNNQDLLFTLADKPFIGPKIYQEFYQKFLEINQPILLPKYQGKKGHPVFIKNKLKTKALKLKGRGGLRNLLELMPEKIYEYQCDYREITVDIDYKKIYRKFKKNNFKLKEDLDET